MNQETQKTDAQITAEFILSLDVHSEYEPVADIPIPLQNGVILKPIEKPEIIKSLIKLDNGEEQEWYDTKGNNTQSTCEGIVMAIGPNCTPYMRIGLKYQYSATAHRDAIRFRHKRQEYISMDEYSVHFIIPDETTIVDAGVKDPRELRRAKKMAQQVKTFDNIHKDEQYKKDVANDKTKGKVHKMK